MNEQQQEKFETWAIVELMGHRKLAGRVSEQVIAGTALLRIDVPEVPASDGDAGMAGFTQFYGAGSIYCLTPTTEDIARRFTYQRRERPVAPYELKALPSSVTVPSAPVPADNYGEPPEPMCISEDCEAEPACDDCGGCEVHCECPDEASN